ncbi:hypothetical protein [Agreia bicolorata]|uniref:hypothetical protein n=1 Tax=Agreia bicolorata TaxID=110935 RepID=UPI00069830CD|nr:hypothetical protein [Agreia bicolorata]
MDSDWRLHLREVSAFAFGQRHRLELMLEIADSEDGIVCLTDLTRALGVTMSSLQRPFESLLQTTLVSPIPDMDSRYRYFRSNPSSAWDWAYELADRTRGVDLAGSWRIDPSEEPSKSNPRDSLPRA